jgi:hypothetical protein
MDDPKKRLSNFLARFSGDQLAVAGMAAGLILLILLLASVLLT